MAKKDTHELTWKQDKIKVESLILDPLNPRLDLAPESTQDDIRLALLETEDVVELAEEIISSGGIMAGERIIIAFEDKKPVVLEGNRRTCAIQMLVNPDLVPASYKKIFPQLEDRTIKTLLTVVDVDISPSRRDAEPLITRRHTKPGIKKWSHEAKTRRLQRFIEQGYNLDELVELVDLPKGEILRANREYQLIQKVKTLPNWSSTEKPLLEGHNVKWNPITRFFTLKGSRAPFGVGFDDDGRFKSSLSEQEENKLLYTMFKPFLITPKGSKPKFTTRSTPQEVYAHVAKEAPEFKKALGTNNSSANKSSSAGKTKKSGRSLPKITKFFESLVCAVDDERLKRLTKEISEINHKTHPIAGTFLQRALVESCLKYRIKKAKLQKELYLSINESKPRNEWKDPGLDAIISFSIKHSDKLFQENVKRALNEWKSLSKDWADLVIHGNFVLPSEEKLRHSADLTRALVQYILSDEELPT